MSYFSNREIGRKLLLALIAWLSISCTNNPTPIPVPPLLPPTPTPDLANVIQNTPALTAVITQVHGKALIIESTSQPRVVKPLQVVRSGSLLQLPADTQVGLICLNDNWIQLSGSIEWELNESNCQNGRLLPTGTYQSMAPQHGRIVNLDGSLLVVERTREQNGDYGNIPVILSPRNTKLLDTPSSLQWIAVEGAIEYKLSLSGLTAFDEIILDSAKLVCVEDTNRNESQICTTEWPNQWKLEAGRRYFLTISARTTIASPLRESETSKLQTIIAVDADAVRTRGTAIRELHLDPETQTLWLANLYAENGIYAEAITSYEQLVDAQPAPATYLMLGDLYRSIELQRYAANAYQSTLDLLKDQEDDLAVRAAVEFGMGQLEYSRSQSELAESHFVTAVDLYRQLESNEELLLAAENALAEVRK